MKYLTKINFKTTIKFLTLFKDDRPLYNVSKKKLVKYPSLSAKLLIKLIRDF